MGKTAGAEDRLGFNESLTNVRDTIWHRLLEVHPPLGRLPPADGLYHYTDVQTAHEIIESRTLWMTPENEARDPLELGYGNMVFAKHWPSAEASGLEELVPGWGINPFAWNGDLPPTYGVYMTCFTEGGDTPHHWQNFASGGRGVNLELDVSSGAGDWSTRGYEEGSKPDVVWLRPVVYEQHAQDALVQALVQEALELVDCVDVRGDGVYFGVRQAIGELLPLFKHPSYRAEDEWRLISTRLTEHTPDYAKIVPWGDGVRGVLEARLKTDAAQTVSFQKAHQRPLPITGGRLGPRASHSWKAVLEALLAKNKQSGAVFTKSNWPVDGRSPG